MSLVYGAKEEEKRGGECACFRKKWLRGQQGMYTGGLVRDEGRNTKG